MTAESEVLQLALGGGIAELYCREHVGMVRLARLIVGSSEVAEEVVHDAFVTVLERQATIEDLARICAAWWSTTAAG